MNSSVARKGSLTLGNGNSSPVVKMKQQKMTECVDLSSDEVDKKVKDKKVAANGNGNSNKNNNNDNKKKVEEKAQSNVSKKPVEDNNKVNQDKKKVGTQDDKEKASLDKKKTTQDDKDKVNQDKKKSAQDDKEKIKQKDVKKNDEQAPVENEEKPKPSTPTLSGKKTQQISSSKIKEEAKQNNSIKKDKKDSEENTASSEVNDESKKSTAPSTPTGKKTNKTVEDSKADTKTETKQKESNKKDTEEAMIVESTPAESEEKSQPEEAKKQTPEPEIFAEKDQLVSSTPAKSTADAAGIANQKKISKSSDNVNSVTLGEIKSRPLDRSSCPTSYSNISGRRSLRPMREYVFQHTNSSLRESYRKINTELDVANESNNTSLNVTVGSEVPSNWSFSFLGRSRKRDRTPTRSENCEFGLNDMDTSPTSPKRARFDFSGFVGILSSPVTMLRERLARAKIQTTPHKLRTSEEDVTDVVNLSSASIEEEPKPVEEESKKEKTPIEVDIEALKEQDKEENKEKVEDKDGAADISGADEALDSDEGTTEVREIETKKKGCIIM